jgi:O-antigen ligase
LGILLCVACLCFFKDETFNFVKEYKNQCILLFFFVLFGIVFSELPRKSVKGGYDFLRGMSLIIPAYLSARLYSEKKVNFEKITLFVILSFSVLLLLFMALFVFNDSFPTFYLYLAGTSASLFGNIHNLVNGTAALLLLCICLVLHSGLNSTMKSALYVCSAFLFFVIVVCRSEGAYLALIFTGFAYVYLHASKWRKAILVVSAALVVGLISLFVFPELYKEYIGIPLGGFEARSRIYRSVLLAFWESPWVGHGINTYKYLPAGKEFKLLFPHQIILECLFSTGFFGLALVCSFYYFILRNVISPVKEQNFLQIFGFLLFVYLIAKGMTDAKYFGYYFSGLIAISIGFMLSTKKI